MPRFPANHEPEPPRAEKRADDRQEVIVADLPPDILALIDAPASPEEEAAFLAWIRGEGPDPWDDSG